MDDVAPFRAGHCENKWVGEERPPTDGAAVIGVGLEKVPELVGGHEPFEVEAGARGRDVHRDSDLKCPRGGGVGEREGAVLRVEGRGDGGVVGATGPTGRE